MYQVGFGDAFLLSFEYDQKLDDGRDRRHVLIDFGSTSPPQSPRKLDSIARHIRNHTASEQDIRADTRGELDVVVVTHRHKDHLSAFASPVIAETLCKPGFPKLVVRSWTENPQAARRATGNVPAITGRGKAVASQSMAFVRSLDAADQFAQDLAHKLGAVGRSSRSLAAEVKQIAEDQISNEAAVAQLEKWAAAGRASYVHYGLTSGIEEVVPGIGVKVLGPPTIDQHPGVLTQRQGDANEFWMIYSGVIQRLRAHDLGAGTKPRTDAGNLPSTVDGEGISAAVNGGTQPAADEPPAPSQHVGPVGPVRWLTDRMARQQLNSLLRIVRTLDGVLNNTSVILLFEVCRSNGEITRLLFPGDAQIENWEYALKYAPDAAANREALRQVDLYKVGHHGSRNATPRTLYNLWTEPQTRDHPLVAMMSTKPGVHGRSPSTFVPRKTLVAALDTRTGGRLYSSHILSGTRPFIELEIDLKTTSGFSEVATTHSPTPASMPDHTTSELFSVMDTGGAGGSLRDLDLGAKLRPTIDLSCTVTQILHDLDALAATSGAPPIGSEVREALQKLLRAYQRLASAARAGSLVHRNVVGLRAELERILVELEAGRELISVGPKPIHIDPSLFPLPRDYRLVNAPSYIPVQLDAGARWSTGQLIVSEVTTGELSLPRGARGLDPLSGEPAGGIVDWQALNPRRTSHRKFRQLIKFRAATLYAIEMGKLFKALGQHDVPLPDAPVMLLHVRRASAPARRAAEALGFVVEEDVDRR